MPYLAPRICQCGKTVSANARCACQARRDRERKARHDANRPSARARGYDSAWEKARAGFLAKHKDCAMCGAPASIVDHIIPHKGDRALFWDRTNWQPLCVPCHSSRKQKQESKQ